jgi:hypothetical protein
MSPSHVLAVFYRSAESGWHREEIAIFSISPL